MNSQLNFNALSAWAAFGSQDKATFLSYLRYCYSHNFAQN